MYDMYDGGAHPARAGSAVVVVQVSILGWGVLPCDSRPRIPDQSAHAART